MPAFACLPAIAPLINQPAPPRPAPPQMAYAELLWLDRLGMYIRAEVAGGPPQVVRVPFYRPVLDERDARSVVTMAAQIAWEAERSYVPPLPDAAAAAAAVNN